MIELLLITMLAALLCGAAPSLITTARHNSIDDLRRMLRRARPRRLLTIREFAERHVIIPSGAKAGERFRTATQPYSRHWLDLVSSRLWPRIWTTGPTQSGKTLLAFVIPIMYYLFEWGEHVICGLPNMDIAADKWSVDLQPAIEASEYSDMLPRSGPGSKGGTPRAITFRNGARLRFMTGGGGDKQRAHYTARVLVMTEIDGFDEPGARSREADKITQLIGRTRAYGSQAAIFGECTVTTELGRIWHEYTAGTHTKLMKPCPHCGEFVFPERDALQGWQDADDELAAQELAGWTCPRSECSQPWSEEQRIEAARNAVPVHKGQTIEADGTIIGDAPPTLSLGFRWTAIDNLFATTGETALDEWRGARSPDSENAEKELCQFVHCSPHKPGRIDETPLDALAICERASKIPAGIVPEWADVVALGTDIGKWRIHWVLGAFRTDGTGSIVQYGELAVGSDSMPTELALQIALRELRDEIVLPGWPTTADETARRTPLAWWIDSRYKPDAIVTFARESAGCGVEIVPAAGYGAGRQYDRRYYVPKAKSTSIVRIGNGYHLARELREGRSFTRASVNADAWKSRLHEQLATPIGTVGALTLHAGDKMTHLGFAQQLVAEAPITEWKPPHGMITKWEVRSRRNHYLDTSMLMLAASADKGAAVVKGGEPTWKPPRPMREYIAGRRRERSRRR